MLGGSFTKFEINLHHVRVASYCTLADRVIVKWALVDILRRLGTLRNGSEPDDRHVHVELHDLGFGQALLLFVPFTTLKEEAINEGSIFRSIHELGQRLVLWNEIKLEFVNRW